MDNLRLQDNDDNAWEIGEGIPQPHDPVVQKYFQGRDALINQEEKQRSDRSFRDTLSPIAKEACAIVSQIRFEELQTVWSTQRDGSQHDKDEAFPGMMFHLAKKQLEETKLFEIVRQMPKGALLHCHLEATVDLEWLFREAVATEGLHIAASAPLVNDSVRSNESFSFDWTKQRSQPDQSIWSPSYEPNALVPLQKAAETFPNGGVQGFLDWLLSRTTVTPTESLEHHTGVHAVWAKFLACFGVLRTLIWYEPILRKFLARFFKQLAEDGISYVDVRAAFAFRYRKLESEDMEEDYLEPMRVLQEELHRFQSTELGSNFWGARVIWTTIRAFDNRQIVKSMNQCIEVKLEFPELIAGFDLVGFEEAGRPLADLLPLLLHFRKLCAQAQVNLPFYLHAAETCQSGTETDQNLYDAILLGTRRLGHAFSLYKHPLLMDMVKEKRICVECCPISNEVLRFTASVMQHPLPAMLAHGVPVALSNDDPGILGQGHSGLSHDFWQVLQGIESVGLEGLAAMVENSIRYASLEDQDNHTWIEDVKNGAYGEGIRAQRLKEWKREWERFAQWIVLEYGVDIDTELEQQD
ncbi:MAG: hypothetical protein Q9159_003480 [Coniocarpon cinnabarinum]